MKLPFKGLYIFTQDFGANPPNYAKYGLKGHDGLDFGCPTRTEIIAPHSGIVIEANFDEPGYGWYVKIENDKEGSVIAHLDEIDVQVGFKLNEGDHIGWSDNTGNSTGPHCHWGYYLFPRDRSNGYAGFIDQEPYLDQAGIHLTLGQLPVIDNTVASSSVPAGTLDTKGLDITNQETLQTLIDTWYDVSHSKYKTAKEYQALDTQLGQVKQQLEDTQKADENVSVELKSYNEMKALGYNTVDDISKKLAQKDTANASLKQENTQLLKRIDVLAGEIQASAQEDHATADLSQQALNENVDLKQTVGEIAKIIGAEKVTPESIIPKLFNLQDIANKYMKYLESKQQGKVVAGKVNQIKQTTSDYILQLFNLIPRKKEVK